MLNKLMYKGKKITLNDGEHDRVHIQYFNHVYRVTDLVADNDKKYHACLQFGFWCPKQALEEPIRGIKFIIGALNDKIKAFKEGKL